MSWHCVSCPDGWLAGCLAQRAVPQMVRERARRSEWEELPFVPPPHPLVIARTTKQPQVSVVFVLEFPSPSLIPCDAASISRSYACGNHHCRFTSCLTSYVIYSFAVFYIAGYPPLYLHHDAKQQQLIHLNGISQNSFRCRSHLEVFVSRCLLVFQGGTEVRMNVCLKTCIFTPTSNIYKTVPHPQKKRKKPKIK